MNQRIEWIDVAKALGIILVVFGHVILGLHDGGLWLNSVNYRIIHDIVYTVHMPLFFFLSGIFAVKWVKREPKRAIGSKAKALLIPYIVWGFIQAAIMQVFSGSTNNGQGLMNAVQLPLIPYAQFWFLYDLFWIFLLYYVLTNYFHLSENIFLFVSFILMTISSTLTYWEFWRISYHIVFFALGTFVLKNKDVFSKFRFIYVFVIWIGLNCAMLSLHLSPIPKTLFTFIVAISGILVLILFSKKILNSKLEKIGRSSMVIYLLHLMFTAGSRIFLLKVGIENFYVQLIVGLVMGIFAPLLLLKISEKLNLRKYLFF